jgi:general stress protein YciG
MNANGSDARKPRGFAALTPEHRREISRKGGVSAHVKGSAHEWDSVAAREAGRKGGLSHSARRTTTPSSPAPPPQAVEAGPPADKERNAS